MKNRDLKSFATNTIAHVFNRGNNREKIFFDEQDYRAFLFRIGLSLGFDKEDLLKEDLLAMPYSKIRINGEKNLFKLHAFCLMPNHFHLLVEQTSDVPISKFLAQVCTSYAMYINKKYNRVGHVFQDQFKAVLVDNNSHLMWLSKYIHMNPVKDKIVDHPEKYVWSSYRYFAKDRNIIFLEKGLLLGSFEGVDNFKNQTLTYDVKDAP